ncbi:MAG: ATP cone domain-containing protein, partial [Planctomycetota bacterium]|nr:ATP cone domain-containing protein [Planctomycetota bacterium]
PQIEEIQDMVEKVLIETGHASTAKAYILYRDRRARARARVLVRAEGWPGAGAGPLVGTPAKALVSPWAKHRITDALLREADLEEAVATEVATRVEEKVFRGRAKRITTAQIRSLVESELFLMGYSETVARQALVGLPRYDVDEMLRGAKGQSWRPSGPRDLKSSVAEAVLAQYALSEVYSAEVVDAHLDARIHLFDVGSPFEWIAAVGRVAKTESVTAWVEGATLLASRLSGVVTREVALCGLLENGWKSDTPRGALLDAARRFLGHPALQTLDLRGGRLRLALDLPLTRHRELAEALISEHWARFREGSLRGLPELVLGLSAEEVEADENRGVLLPALAAAAETGRIRFAVGREGPPPLVTPWYRIPGAEAAEERTAAGPAAVGVAGAAAINVLALAASLPEPSEEGLLQALESALVLATKALRQKRSFMGALSSDPSTPLYRVCSGAHPLVAGGHGLDLVHLVGVRAAAELFLGVGKAAPKVAARIRSYAALRAAEEGRRVRLHIVVAPDRDGEASRRFLAADRKRNDRVAHAYPEEGGATPGEQESFDLALGAGTLVPALEPVSGTLSLRFPRDSAPGPEALYDAFRHLARNPRIHVVHLVPWPDRQVRAADTSRPI